MKLPYRPIEHKALCVTLARLASELGDLEHEARSAWKLERADGYPKSSSLDGGGRSSIVDEFGVPMPPLSDPVGELVVNEQQDSGKVLTNAWRMLQDAVRTLERARGVLYDVAHPPEPVPEESLDWCSVCFRVKLEDTHTGRRLPVLSPTASNVVLGGQARTRCSACHSWAVQATYDPTLPAERPRSLIVKQARGFRIYDADVDATRSTRKTPPEGGAVSAGAS